MVRPSTQFSSRNRPMKAAVQGPQTEELAPRIPMVGGLPVCCARAASGQATADPTIPLMKSRRRIACPGLRTTPTMGLQQEFATGGMGSDRHFAWQQSSGSNVRFGSLADIETCLRDARFTPVTVRVRQDVDLQVLISQRFGVVVA